ncbi:acetyl-CoA hydrolase/transferase C-terminal domain-containing protein [Sphingomonas floccifaciens]|uniref:Acetyl-CoA hydrolase/transferase C-terminal domain-containing protein n=1 Tax=Sphingomonas floccifaciens TaxID=1844115 RepID=A0ABW4NJS6_9SPHN
MTRRIERGDLASVLPAGGLTLVSSCSAESGVLADAVAMAGEALGDMTFCGIFVPGLNRRSWRAGAASRVLTFFQTPELRAEGARVEFLPLCYQDILREIRRRRPRAALFTCSPPDAAGRCSFGTEVAFIAELWRDIPVRIAHINPSMPQTAGDVGIPFDALTAFIEEDAPLLGTPARPADGTAAAIAFHVAPFVRDGDTLQTGLGKVPDAVLAALVDRRELRLHSGLVGDGALALVESGSLRAATVGCAIGSPALYEAVRHPPFDFRPVSVTHGPAVLAGLRLVTINSALEVDLYGQAYAELTATGWISGPGGASDYARGARTDGLRIVVLPARARDVSRIILPADAAGPVSLGRMDVDVVITEHGAADLRGLSHPARASALIAIAAPDHRAALTQGWDALSVRF